MNSQTIPQFWQRYDRLPQQIQQQANQVYRRWRKTPHLPGLSFKRVGKTRPVYSVRITDDYRALGLLDRRRYDHLVLDWQS